MTQPDPNKIAAHYSEILKELGADLESEGMKETPLRAAKALVEMTEGSRMETDQLTKMFKAECKTAVCHDMVIVEGIKEGTSSAADSNEHHHRLHSR
jgi:GTP cyclohydrolase I